MIDLTEDDNDSAGERHSNSCGNPHHASTLSSMRKKLHDQQREIAVFKQQIAARDAASAERQARIADLQARDAGRLAEIARLQAKVDMLQDRLSGRGKRQKRVSYLLVLAILFWAIIPILFPSFL